MELLSGRMPTGGSFGVDIDTVRRVESRMEIQGSEHEKLIDPLLKPLLPNEETAAFQVLEVALQCTKTAPAERLSSRHACNLLIHVLDNKMVQSEKMGPDHLYALVHDLKKSLSEVRPVICWCLPTYNLVFIDSFSLPPSTNK
ncbi:unnamed protein product [Fraxinus pennsylvanica]|uniref:Uncharacterized protein n=1 Tax=Fraxinus pennsylvanica TaxID=56036 RepID=A0AAD2E0P0_9LAMI|nr:unnamed protein product [Fraxinus pennsylvanica]